MSLFGVTMKIVLEKLKIFYIKINLNYKKNNFIINFLIKFKINFHLF